MKTSSKSTITLPDIHRNSILSPKRQSASHIIKGIDISKLRLCKVPQGPKPPKKISNKKLNYIFEQEHDDDVPDSQLIKERQEVFLRVHKILKRRFQQYPAKARGLRSPNRLRKVLMSPQFRRNGGEMSQPSLNINRVFSPQRILKSNF